VAAPGAMPPERQMMSVDGAMVHATTGEWREVKTLMVAELQPNGEAVQPSYFSRMAEHRVFAAQAASEVQRRQVTRSGAVCAVADGAEYNQAVIDHLCPGATRILAKTPTPVPATSSSNVANCATATPTGC
jgi:hypothetical protein